VLATALTNVALSFSFHVKLGKPPVDGYGRPLYGGNPFAPPGSGTQDSVPNSGLVTSDGKTITKGSWGGLPTADFIIGGDDDEDTSSEEEDGSSASDDNEAMDESDSEEAVVVGSAEDGIESVLPPPPHVLAATAPGDLRKQQSGDETPLVQSPKQLYQVLEQTKGTAATGAVFGSEVQYVVPGSGGLDTAVTNVPEGAESVLTKAIAPSDNAKSKRRQDGDDEEEDLGKNFKF
jgi:splicing factor 3B subunit 2